MNIERLLVKSVPMVIWVLSYLGIVLSMPLFLDTSVLFPIWTPMSGFTFWKLVSDFGHDCPILDF